MVNFLFSAHLLLFPHLLLMWPHISLTLPFCCCFCPFFLGGGGFFWFLFLLLWLQQGQENNTKKAEDKNKKTLFLQGFGAFGGRDLAKEKPKKTNQTKNNCYSKILFCSYHFCLIFVCLSSPFLFLLPSFCFFTPLSLVKATKENNKKEETRDKTKNNNKETHQKQNKNSQNEENKI